MLSTLPGRHNLMNTLAVIAVASLIGIASATIQEALLAFQGVKRRQEILGEAGGVLVIDDFAHHPTAVQETIQAMRFYYPNRRIIALFEPRTNSSRRNVFQADYEAAFDGSGCDLYQGTCRAGQHSRRGTAGYPRPGCRHLQAQPFRPFLSAR